MTEQLEHAYEVTSATASGAVQFIAKHTGVCEHVALTMLTDYLVLTLLERAPEETRLYLTTLCQEWIESDVPGDVVGDLLNNLVEKLHE